MDKIKNIQIIDSEENVKTIPAAISQIYYNEKNNLEISNNFEDDEAGSKINIVSKGAIQIKPGVTKKGKTAAIALDSENDTVNPTEVLVQVTNGADGDYKDKTMRLKLQAAEVVLDTKDAYAGDFDANEIHIKARCDNKENPVYVKHHGRAFDFRCHDHGGIALQIAGKDSDNHENKIKFESDRTNAVTAANGTYNGEGGKGLEFATFNNLHTSIFTKDYRFNKDGMVYAVTRQTPTTVDGKTDYPTQTDDFKDVIGMDTASATWEGIVSAGNIMSQDGCSFDPVHHELHLVLGDEGDELALGSSIKTHSDLTVEATDSIIMSVGAEDISSVQIDPNGVNIRCKNNVSNVDIADGITMFSREQFGLTADNGIEIASDGSFSVQNTEDITFIVNDSDNNQYTISMIDIAKMIEYFKTNNSEIFA